MLVDLKRKFRTIDSAEAALGITVESYIDVSPCQPTATDHIDQDLNLSPSLAGKLSCLSKSQLKDLIIESLRLLGCDVDVIVQLIKMLLVEQPDLDVLAITDQLYALVAEKMGLTSTVLGFVRLSLEAMRRLELNDKVNLVIKFCQGFANERPDKSGPLIPLHRMLFGLLQYCIEFFTCTNVMQVTLFHQMYTQFIDLQCTQCTHQYYDRHIFITEGDQKIPFVSFTSFIIVTCYVVVVLCT